MTRTLAPLALVIALLSGASAQQPPPGSPPPQPAPQTPDPQRPAPPQGTQPQETTAQQPTFRTGINFVRVDVIVSDRAGQPIVDLAQADFEVLEDGKPQKIEQFRLIKLDGNPRDGQAPREIRTRYDEETETAREDTRLFVIFLDDYHTRIGSALAVKEPLVRFVEQQLGPDDLVAVMYPLTPLDAVSPTRNHKAIVSAIRNFEGRKFRYDPRNSFEERYANYPAEVVERIRNEVVMTALRGLSSRLGSMREGRKAIIFVSEGLTGMLPPQMRNPIATMPGLGNPNARNPLAGENDPREDTMSFFNQADLYSQMRDVYDAANRNNAAIYALDPRGMATGEFAINEPVGLQQDQKFLQASQDTLRTLASETDGRAIVNRNDLSKGLAQIVRDSSAYYLIGYNSTQAPTDGKFHEIKVRVKRPGADVRARKGYWALTPEATAKALAPPKPEAPKAVQQALASIATPVQSGKFVRTWLGYAPGTAGKTRVTFVWEPIPSPPGVRREQPGRVSLAAADAAGELVFKGRVPDESAAATGPQRVTFEAAPGKTELRLSVEGASGEVLDSEIRDVSVPDLTTPQVGLSTPRVFRARTAREFQGIASNPDAVPVASREFSRTERLLLRFDVRAPGSETPAVTAALLNRNGSKMVDIPVAAAPTGGSHQVDMGLGAIPPGEYLVEITVKGGGGEAKELVPLKVGA